MIAHRSRPLANEEVGHKWSASVVAIVHQTGRLSFGTRLSQTAEIDGMMSGNECKVILDIHSMRDKSTTLSVSRAQLRFPK